MQTWGVSQFWMPFVASCLFTVPLLGFLFLLDKIPPPTPLDEVQRTKRLPMNGAERKKFAITFLPGIFLFVAAYMLLTAFRDFRDNFSAEIWHSLGLGNDPSIYTTTEVPVSIAVLGCMASLMLIKNNKLALMINHLIIAAGMLTIGVSNYLFELSLITPTLWMTLMGLGLYLSYIPFNCIFFDRLIAAFQYTSTVGFIMYVSDSFGYLGSVCIVLFKEFGFAKLSWLTFFISGGYFISIVGTLLIFGSMLYFHLKHHLWRST